MTETCVLAPEFASEKGKGGGVAKSDGPVFEIDPLQDPRWKTLLDGRADAAIFHRPEWLQALKASYGYDSRVLSSTPPGEALQNGLLFCEVRSPLTGKRIVSVPFSDHCEPLINNGEDLQALLQNLMGRVERGEQRYVEVRPVELAPQPSAAFAISTQYYLHRLDLGHSEEKLFRSFHKDCVQRKIRRAEREALRYEEGSSDVLLNHFYKLLIITRRRQGVPPQPMKWFRALISSLGSKLKIRVALQGEMPVASILTISDRTKMIYKYGCSDPRFNNLGGTPFLFWRAIQDAVTNGMEEFDLGRSDPGNSGLVTFKEHWGAKRVALNYWRYPAHAAGLGPERAITHIRKLISILPDTPLVALGRLLYPHIG
jgi:CelD/BcsL family acetyltransferase involved in cellulose biosynthesis